MASIQKINGVLCITIAKLDDVLEANIKKVDDINFCTLNCRLGTIETGTYSFWDCCGDYFEGFNGSPALTCYDANLPFNNITDGGSTCTVSCTPTPTPTPSPTPTPTPTPTPCPPGCCFVELCYSDKDCAAVCVCLDLRPVYLHQPCQDDPCELAYADGIFEDPGCSTPATEGYYSSGTDCWYWNATDLTLTYQGPC
jgi:hypothetical protein